MRESLSYQFSACYTYKEKGTLFFSLGGAAEEPAMLCGSKGEPKRM